MNVDDGTLAGPVAPEPAGPAPPGTDADCVEPIWREADRLAALERYAILDTGREATFDEVAALAADLLDAPMAVVNLIAADRQWFKAEVGIGTDSLPLDVSICRHAILQPGVMVVPDLRDDPRFEGNPLVHVAGGLRFYAGALLETPEGLPLGTVCVLDREPRPEGISDRQRRALAMLASQAMAQIELRRARDEAQGVTRRQAFLLRMSDVLRPLSDPDEIRFAAASVLGQHLGASRVAYAEDLGDGRYVVTRNYLEDAADAQGVYRYEDFGAEVLVDLQAGRSHVRPDTMSDPSLSDAGREALRTFGIGASLNVPLLKDGRLVAFLGVSFPDAHAFTPDEIGLSQAVVERTWDAVERARAEAALRESEERLRLATDQAEIGFWDVEAGHGTLTWPPRVKAMFGISADRPVTMDDFYAGLHPDDLPRVAEAYASAADPVRRALYDVEYRTIGKEDALVRWVAAKGRGVFDGDGPHARCVRVIGTAIDVTARKQAEAALAESEARFRNMADHAPVMMWTTDPSGSCTYLNRGWYAFTGQSEDEAPGFGWLEATHPDDKAEAEGVFLEANADQTPFRLEYRLRRADGEYRWAIDAAAPRFGPRGEFLGYIGSVIDITERKEVEAALQQVNETLESRVTQAIAERELAEEALRQSQKMEAMGQLTGGVAHDFNNLLTPILAVLDRLQRQGLGGDREQRLIDGALQSAERAKTLVQRLLAFARRQPLQPEPIDVDALVRGMTELVASTTGPRIDVRVNIAPDLPHALADANQLEMALLNLVVNARDAMPDGGQLTIAAVRDSVRGLHRARLRPGHYVRLSAQDTGTGMDEVTLARAVEPFFSTKGVGRGTGLGLSMVHGLASQLGGGLDITSQRGRGTTVDLWLPMSTVTADSDVPGPEAKPVHAARGIAVLVDDEDLVRMSTAAMLVDLGYEVVEASSAEEALRLLGEGLQPDLVVTDHLMPGLSGVDLARDLRARRPDLPVLIVSGYADVDGIAPGLPRLAKPFRNSELAASLAAMMATGA